MKKTKVLLALVITFSLSMVTSNIAYADNGVDPEIDVSWTPIKKPSSKYVYPKCKEQKILLNPKRDFLGIAINVKDSKGDTIGFHGTIILNMPKNQVSEKKVRFCFPLNLGKKVKYPLKLELYLKYPYTAPEKGSDRYLEIPYKFKKKK
jgi:hypothetical protein